MKNEVLHICKDEVIGAKYFVAVASYDFAIEKLLPRITELEIQRAPIEADLYERLYKDIIKGCIMPPITIALVRERNDIEALDSIEQANEYITKNIDDCFVLDGVQRLHTLNRICQKDEADLDKKRPIYVNYIIAESMDKLLYRMITLNNGQKPMSIRHQVEILSDNMFDFETVPVKMVTEKQRTTGYRTRNKVEFKKSSVVTAYLAYMSGSNSIDNKKIVDDLLNRLVADKILSTGIANDEYTEFKDIMAALSQWMSESEVLKKWFKIENNLIAFCAAAKKNDGSIVESSTDEIVRDTDCVESAFDAYDQSKIRVQTVRRKINDLYFSNYSQNRSISKSEFLEKVMQEII